MPTQASLLEVSDEVVDGIYVYPIVTETERAYTDALRTVRNLADGNPILGRALLDLDAAAGARSYATLASGYALGRQAAL